MRSRDSEESPKELDAVGDRDSHEYEPDYGDEGVHEDEECAMMGFVSIVGGEK